MFRKMRRFKQLLSEEENLRILREGRTGIMACLGDDGYPYTVPLNYVYVDGKIYFHCAKTGHKLDAITACDKVSFCVIDRDDVDADARATNFRSVIVFGRAKIVTDEEQKLLRARQFGAKYASSMEAVDQEIKETWNSLVIVEITPEHVTGKERKTLAEARRAGGTQHC